MEDLEIDMYIRSMQEFTYIGLNPVQLKAEDT